MVVDILNNLATMGEQRTKINNNFATLDDAINAILEEIIASSYLRNGTITCTDADEWYTLSGILIRKSTEGFTVNGDSISYASLINRILKINYFVSTKCSKNGATLTFAVRKTRATIETIITGSDKPREFSTGSLGSLSNGTTEEIQTGDKLQLVVKSSIAANVLTELSINTVVTKAHSK